MQLYRTLCAIVALVLLTAGSCERGSKPNPKPRKTHVVSYGYTVALCAEQSTLLRAPDKVCTDATPGFAWYFISDGVVFSLELPAVGEQIEPARGNWFEPDTNKVESIPDEGAWFSRNPPLWVTPSPS